MLDITLLEVAGMKALESSLRLPYSLHPLETEEAKPLISKLVKRGDDHAKALRFLKVWLRITAPRYWWLEFATYRVGVESVSQSTMHTLLKRNLTQKDFVSPIPQGTLNRLNSYIRKGNLIKVKAEMPEGFLQDRVVELNYQSLKRIIEARKNHTLPEWRQFVAHIRILHLPFAKEAGFEE